MEISKTKRELKRFIIAGLFAVGTDLISYYLLLNILTHNYAKGISFLFGTIVAYFINKFWTFQKNEKSFKELIQFGLLYFFTLILNVIVNNITLELSGNIVLLAFIVATTTSTILNFVGQKWWVFK